MNVLHPEIIATLQSAGWANPQLGPWSAVTITADGSVTAIFKHGTVRFAADGAIIMPTAESPFYVPATEAAARRQATRP